MLVNFVNVIKILFQMLFPFYFFFLVNALKEN